MEASVSNFRSVSKTMILISEIAVECSSLLSLPKKAITQRLINKHRAVFN